MRPMRRGELAAREAVHRDPETGVQLRRRGHSLTLVESSPLRSAGGKRVGAHVDCHGSGCLHGTPIRSGSIARQVDETATVTAMAMSLGPGEVLGSKLGQMRCVRHTSSFDAGTWDRGWVEAEVSSLGGRRCSTNKGHVQGRYVCTVGRYFLNPAMSRWIQGVALAANFSLLPSTTTRHLLQFSNLPGRRHRPCVDADQHDCPRILST